MLAFRQLIVYFVYHLQVRKSCDEATGRDTRQRYDSDYDASCHSC